MAFVSTLCIILIILAMLLIPVSFLTFIIMLCCKHKRKAAVFGFITLGLFCSILPLAMIGYLTDPATWCEHQYEIIEQADATCINKGSILKECKLCGDDQTEELEIVDHAWVITEDTQASCTNQGIKVTQCSVCDKTKTSTTDILPHSLSVERTEEATCDNPKRIYKKCDNCSYTVEETSGNPLSHVLTIERTEEATCDSPKYIYKKCDNCSYTEEETVGEPLKHVLSTERTEKATCISPMKIHKKCDNCSYTEIETVGEPTAHTYGKWVIEKKASAEACGLQSKTCSYCQHKITEEIKKISPITISSIKYSIDYVGGVEWIFKIKSNSQKTIKYITIQWDCYNAVNDLVYDEISRRSNCGIQITGPIEYGASGSWCNTTKFYNHNYDHMNITKIEVEFMDGTKIRLSEKEYSNIFD